MNFRNWRHGILILVSVLSALILLTNVGATSAQDAERAPTAATSAQLQLDDVAQQIAGFDRELDSLSDKVSADGVGDTALLRLKVQAEGLSDKVLAVDQQLKAELEEVERRLTALGAVPEGGEDAIVAAERKTLNARRASLNTLLTHTADTSSQLGKVISDINAKRRAIFTDAILERTTIDGNVFEQAYEEYQSQSSVLWTKLSSWGQFVLSFKRFSLLGALFLSLSAALVLVVIGYRLFGPLLFRDPDEEDPPYLSRLSLAFWSTVVPTAGLAVFCGLSLFFLNSFNVLRADIEPMVRAFLQVVVVFFLVYKVSRSTLAPWLANWRLVRVSNAGARQLTIAILMLAVINSMDYLASGVSAALGAALVLTVVKSFLAAVLSGLVILRMAFMRPLLGADDALSAAGRPWPRTVVALLITVGLTLIISAGVGYVGLAGFIASQIVITGAIGVTMYIGFLSARAVSEKHAFAATAVGKMLIGRFSPSDTTLDQIGLAGGLALNLLVLAIGLPLILMQWGFHFVDIWFWVSNTFSEFTIGSISISLAGIVTGAVIFFIGLMATRMFTRWLDGNVLDRSQLDSGVRNSVRTGVGYVGIAVAALIGVSAAGIDLSSLALVAGALSLGIGFGLQNIVSNFVSGLILLVERPFKIGDWVVTSSAEGFVKQISVRATEIETFQHQSIIVPNSELINAAVGNWTHRNRLGRAEVAVGVSYDADPRRVIDLLIGLADAHDLVLKFPEPSVEFVGFGDSSVDFILRVHLADVLDGFGVRNDLRIAIFERFREEGIEIPFPQRDVNLHVKTPETAAPIKVDTPPPVHENPHHVADTMGEDGGGTQ